MKFSKLFVFVVLLSGPIGALAQKITADEVLTRHLESIGTLEARAAVKTLIAVGDATAKFVSSKDQVVQGRVVFASEGIKNFFGLNMNSIQYPGERFSFDGRNTNVAFATTGNRSVLGNFVQSNSMILVEGIFGGTLSSSWVVFNMAGGKGKLSSDGTKKIDGKDAYVMAYSRKGGGDVSITMYFDKETFRHVRTEYQRTSSAGIGLRPEDSTRYSETKLKVIEDFSGFKSENGLTLPRNYRLFYSITGQNGTTEIEWLSVLTEFAYNQKLDPKTFDAAAN